MRPNVPKRPLETGDNPPATTAPEPTSKRSDPTARERCLPQRSRRPRQDPAPTKPQQTSHPGGGWGGRPRHGGWIRPWPQLRPKPRAWRREWAGPDAPSESPPDLPSWENLSAAQGPQVNQRQDSQKPRTVSPLKGNQTEKKTIPTNSVKTEKQVS